MSNLSNPIHPTGTPPHVAYYLAVDDADGRAEAATVAGVQLVLAPFDADDRGRMTILVDPVEAAFSLWRRREFDGWSLPPGSPNAPLCVVLSCERPKRAEAFHRAMLGSDLAYADFRAAQRTEASAGQWELAVADTENVTDLARIHASGLVPRADHAGDRAMRLSSPEAWRFGSSR